MRSPSHTGGRESKEHQTPDQGVKKPSGRGAETGDKAMVVKCEVYNLVVSRVFAVQSFRLFYVFEFFTT